MAVLRSGWSCAVGPGVLAVLAACGPSASGATQVIVSIDASQPGPAISPLIRGISGDWTPDEMRAAGVRLDSWGGNPSTRFNYELGYAWNAARDWGYQNVNYSGVTEDAAAAFLRTDDEAGVATRLAVPTLGWVAKDPDNTHCSFPDGSGGCQTPDADCTHPGPIADPRATSTESTSEMVAAWISRLVADGLAPDYIALDNEPDIWGYTHYDVHPECTTFEEVLDRYIEYGQALREVAPDADLLGPVICCWYDFWRPDACPADGSDEDFVSWFLRNMAAADAAFGQRTLDGLDVHYYPQSDVFNDDTSAETNARRLRSTSALWDPEYTDESWIGEPIALIPNLRESVRDNYPDTPIVISEWNFGAEESMNGALAIADVLGIYGREQVAAAAYWRSPEPGSPGFFAFGMHGNYDGDGSAFEGSVLPVTVSGDDSLIRSYAAVDATTGVVRVMLINERPDASVEIGLELSGASTSGTARGFTYGPDAPDEIVESELDVTAPITVPAYSIVVLELST